MPTPTSALDNPSARLWMELPSTTNQMAALTVLCGFPERWVDTIALLFVAQSDQAAEFVATVPGMLRHLTHQTVTRSELCLGHIRGPVLWSETVTASASALGAEDVFVCGSPVRDFDMAENRLLVWLLRRLRLASNRTSTEAAAWFGPAAIERVRSTGVAARSVLAHRALAGIDGRQITAREVRRASSGRNAADYEIATDLYHRLLRPFTAENVVAAADRTTREEHRLVELMLDALRSEAHLMPPLTIRNGDLNAGPLTYRSAMRNDDGTPSGLAGRLTLGDFEICGGGSRLGAAIEGRQVREVRTADEARGVVAEAQSLSGLTQLPGSYSSSSSSISESSEVRPSTGESFRIDS